MPDQITNAPQETGALIDRILTRCHEMHWADRTSLVPLAKRVERVHDDDPDIPRGLDRTLATLRDALEDRRTAEELILILAMRADGVPGIELPIAVMRADHDDHADSIALIRKLTHDLTPPERACGSWLSHYRGTATLLDDLAAHIALENGVLFPRFEPAA